MKGGMLNQMAAADSSDEQGTDDDDNHTNDGRVVPPTLNKQRNEGYSYSHHC
jgi:hypothetical protein